MIFFVRRMSPLLALSGHPRVHCTCPLHDRLPMSAFLVAIGCKADMSLCAAYVCF
jgi:hypothetical protein